MRDVLTACDHALGNKAQLTWVDVAFLAAHGVEGWSDLPMWVDNHGENAGFGTRQNAKAVRAGLSFRPIADTARDTLAWLATLSDEERTKARSSGIKRDRETALLAEWHARR
jgi:2'-hydroxyisoflavone reductase